MSERQANTPTLRALLPSRLVPEDMLSEWQGPNLPNTKNYAPPPDSMRGRMGDVLSQGIAALGGFTGLPMGGEGSKAALLGELLAAGMPLVGGIKALPGAKVLAGPAWEKALRFYAEAGGLAERHVPRMANALQRAGIKVPARSVAEKVAAHKIVNEALDLAHTPAGPVEGPFAAAAQKRKALSSFTPEDADLDNAWVADAVKRKDWSSINEVLGVQLGENQRVVGGRIKTPPTGDPWGGAGSRINAQDVELDIVDETPTPAPLMDMLRSIDDKYGIYAKRAKRATK